MTFYAYSGYGNKIFAVSRMRFTIMGEEEDCQLNGRQGYRNLLKIQRWQPSCIKVEERDRKIPETI